MNGRDCYLMRYRIVVHEGVKYGLRRGETLEQLLAAPNYLIPEDEALCVPSPPLTGEVKSSYLILGEGGYLVDRARRKRSHHKVRLQERPRFGPGSGKQGAARAATHYRSHVADGLVPPGTLPADCPVCEVGILYYRWKQAEREERERDDRLFEREERLREQEDEPLPMSLTVPIVRHPPEDDPDVVI